MVYIFLADGFEEMEAVIPFDLMKRAGIKVTTVGVGGKNVTGAHGLAVTADIAEGELGLGDAEAIVFPGGMPGALNLKNSETVNNAITFALHNDIVIGAICASPGVVLASSGALEGKRYTCFPGFEVAEGNYTAAKTEKDGKLITANGPEAAEEFAKELIGVILG